MYLRFLSTWALLQITGETVGEVRTVSDMHQRKAEMARQADAFIALPGIDPHSKLKNKRSQSLICSEHN